jgi:hypothetical protein
MRRRSKLWLFAALIVVVIPVGKAQTQVTRVHSGIIEVHADPDAQTIRYARIAAGSTLLSTTAPTFGSGDCSPPGEGCSGGSNKTIIIDYAGEAGAPLVTSIVAFADAQHVTVAVPAAISVPYQFVSGCGVHRSQSGPGSYSPGDTVTLAGGTFIRPGTCIVRATEVASFTLLSGGTGGTTDQGSSNGSCEVSGATGAGRRFVMHVNLVDGRITSVKAVVNKGVYTRNPAQITAEPILGCGKLWGAVLSLRMGVLWATPDVPGVYSKAPTGRVSQDSTSGLGTGAVFAPIYDNAGLSIYGTDASAAFAEAINAANAIEAGGRQACVYAPAGTYLLNETPLPSFSRNGCIVGDGPLKTTLYIGPCYNGDVFSWSDAWMGDSYPFGGSTPDLSTQKAGPMARGFTIIGDRTSTLNQNALTLYDRTDFALFENITVHSVKGRGFYAGITRNSRQAFVRESTFRSLRFWNVGDAGRPVFELNATGDGPSTNEINISDLDIYGPYGVGLVIRSTGPKSGDIKFARTRIEGKENNPAAVDADLLQIGDEALPGAINSLSFVQLELIDPYIGRSAMRLVAPTPEAMPYLIRAEGKISGGLSFGRGLVLENGRRSRFQFSQINTRDYNIVVRPPPNTGPDILLDGDGQENQWSYSIDRAAAANISIPKWQRGGLQRERDD